MIRLVPLGIALALILNAVAWKLQLGYLGSVGLVFGSMTLWLFARAVKMFRGCDWKLFAGFFLFSNLATLGLEILMLHFDVWGFSRITRTLSGATWLGAPVEEYIYWALCPAIVALLYLVQARTDTAPRPEPRRLRPLVELARRLDLLKAPQDKVEYKAREDIDAASHYAAGRPFLVYVWVQVAIVATILMLVRSFHGSWRHMFSTTLIFTACAFPNEYYSLHAGFWVYNTSRLLGIYLLDIPLEGWLMYFLSPVCACMMLDIANRKLFGRDI